MNDVDIRNLVAEVGNLPNRTDAQQGIVGLLQGIIYSIRRARELGFDSRSGSVGDNYWRLLDDTSGRLEQGGAPDSFWLSGFFFNSAVIRIAAASHRALRLLFGVDDGSFHDLANRAVAEGRVTEAAIVRLRECYRDVNDFKHDADALLLSSRRVATVAQAAEAAEQLVQLVKQAV